MRNVSNLSNLADLFLFFQRDVLKAKSVQKICHMLATFPTVLLANVDQQLSKFWKNFRQFVRNVRLWSGTTKVRQCAGLVGLEEILQNGYLYAPVGGEKSNRVCPQKITLMLPSQKIN